MFSEGFLGRIPSATKLLPGCQILYVIDDFKDHSAYCEIPDFMTLESCIGYRILWSGYKVRPVGSSNASPTSVGHQLPASTVTHPIQPFVDVNCESGGSTFDIRAEFTQAAQGWIPAIASDEDDRDDRLYSSNEDSRRSAHHLPNVHGLSNDGDGGSNPSVGDSFVDADENIASSGSRDLNCSSGGTQSGLPFSNRPLWRNQ